MAANINFPDYSNPRLLHFAVQLNSCELIGNRVHKLTHQGEAAVIFNGLYPPLERLLVNLLCPAGIRGERPETQNQLSQQIYAHNGNPDIFHKIACDGALDTSGKLPVETAVLVGRNDRDILGAGVSENKSMQAAIHSEPAGT